MAGPLFGLVAGERSGDLLAAALIEALRRRVPDARFVGLTGDAMQAAGCESLGSADELAVMGLVEPLRHLPRLLRLRSRLREDLRRRGIAAFVGVDAPAFNLGLAAALRAAGIPTVQYVSPQVWAWRAGRVPGIARAVDAVLCLLPFEPACYAGHPVRAEFVGHPFADRIGLDHARDRALARQALGLGETDRVLAVLPGSRLGEVERLGADFAAAARQLEATGLVSACVAPMASATVAEVFTRQVRKAGTGLRLLAGRADEALAAADAALVASGTATLQALLHGCPMVVAYRLAPLTAFIARDLGLVKLRHFSLPNLLAGEALVPEFFQRAVSAPALADALRPLLQDDGMAARLRQRFASIHRALRRDAAARAAQVILEVARVPGAGGA